LNQPLHIGVNALYLIPGAVGGTEIYLRSLLRNLAAIDPVNRYTVFTNKETGCDLVPSCPNFEWAPQPVTASIRPARILWEQFALPIEVMNRNIDVLFNPGFTSPTFAPCEFVTVFHDMQHSRHPGNFRWFDLPFWRILLYLSAMRSNSLIAVSQATLEDMLAHYRLRRNKVWLAQHGVDEGMFEVARARDEDKSNPFVLCVSTLHVHKNIDRLLFAFDAFRKRKPGHRLVLVGLRGFHTAEIEQLIEALDLSDCVEVTGWIEREALYHLFRQASAFIYPSKFEGFGMPVLEAMAAGVPTACSAVEPLSGISGNAALHFDPESIEAITDALIRLTSDEELRRRLAVEGPRRAAQFSWRDAAQKTLEAILHAARK
jgi:glycosyltransferase involved in cell wall biosynthesis